MNWDDWLQTEPTGQKFMTGPEAVRFMRLHPDRCHASGDETGLPDVVILDKPHKLRLIQEVDLYWLEVMKMKDLVMWPPDFGVPYTGSNVDPKLFEVQLEGGLVAPAVHGTELQVHGRYQDRTVMAGFPCSPAMLAQCGAKALDSLKGRFVMDIGEEEFGSAAD